MRGILIASVVSALLLTGSLHAQEPASQEELKALILQHLAEEVEEFGRCYRYFYSFEECDLVVRTTYCDEPPPRTAQDWSTTMSRVPLQEMKPKVWLGGASHYVHLTAADNRKVIEAKMRWPHMSTDSKPIERMVYTQGFFARSHSHQELLSQELRQLIQLCREAAGN